MKRIALLIVALIVTLLCSVAYAASDDPVSRLVDRISKGASSKFIFELTDQQAEEDFFELDQKIGKVVVRGNNYVSIATGLNWYLKYHAGVHISWNNPHPNLNIKMPAVKTPERRSTEQLMRYYLNYCTFSYSMAFWGWDRWEQEIDWMVLHGINLPLSITGAGTVWRNTLQRLGYSKDEVNQFVAGPAYQAWWLMNNLEGWGGPNLDTWYDSQAELEKKIVARYQELGVNPVFAGYCGMVPNNAKEKLGLNVQDPGEWCRYRRPAFLQPTDPRFGEIADIYYQEMEKLFGQGKYFALDPFHEGGSVAGIDLKAVGSALYGAMKKANPAAVWVAQSWQSCPYQKMIDHLPQGDVIVLDLFSESRPQWGDQKSLWYRPDGFGHHQWLYCMLLNFGGNVGMYGKMDRLIDGYYMAKTHNNGKTLSGVGATMEGIENNPVMYELIFELPWRPEKFTKKEWIENWVKARYGRTTPQAVSAWNIMSNTAYAAPYEGTQEGTTESVLCGRPALKIDKVSSWGTAVMYYRAAEFEKALVDMVAVAEKYRGCNNFEYDLVDVARQAVANRGNVLLQQIEKAAEKKNSSFNKLSDAFLSLLPLQDSLLMSRSEFMVGPWLEMAVKMGKNSAEREFYLWNARTIITVWGDRHAANVGGLRDYAHREWSGLMNDFYYKRWKQFFDEMKSGEIKTTDYFDMEYAWTVDNNPYPTSAVTDPVDMSKLVLKRLESLPGKE